MEESSKLADIIRGEKAKDFELLSPTNGPIKELIESNRSDGSQSNCSNKSGFETIE